MQGQLNISEREICHFVIFIDKDKEIFTEIIRKDQQFWLNEMLPHLTAFYTECILSEIVLKRIPRGKTCKESTSILQAQEARKNKEATKNNKRQKL